MAVLAAMTLVLGVYPDPLLTPLTGYIQSMFEGDNSVLPIPTAIPASAGSDVPVKSNTILPSISLGGGTDENDENADVENDHSWLKPNIGGEIPVNYNVSFWRLNEVSGWNSWI